MYREEYGHYSWILDKDMRIIIYGNSGMPLLCFPTQNSMSNNYEDFGMIDQLADFIEDGRIQLFTVDSVDVESWSLNEVFFNGWMNPTLYENSPERFLPQMPADHPYIGLYNERRMILCCGQGAWEEDSLRTLKYLESVFSEKGIHAWCDFWGYDVNHDWPWWYKQMRYFLPFMLSNQ